MKKPYERIVVPLDGSKEAETSLSHAIPLCQASGATLILFRTIWDPLESLVSSSNSRHKRNRERARSYLEDLQGKLSALDVKSEIILSEETVPRGLERLENQVDMVIMASSGRTGLARWARGSVTENVVDVLNCPVLVIQIEEDGLGKACH